MALASILRLGALSLVAAALAAVTWLIVDRFHQKDIADAAARCEAAAVSPTEQLTDCGSNVLARVAADRRTIVCEGALLPELRDETRFTARQACGAGTLRLIAQSDAQSQRIAGIEGQLAKTRADTADAVARAETRGRTEQIRRENAQQLIQAAPRSADGRITCDAVCLRKLAN